MANLSFTSSETKLGMCSFPGLEPETRSNVALQNARPRLISCLGRSAIQLNDPLGHKG